MFYCGLSHGLDGDFMFTGLIQKKGVFKGMELKNGGASIEIGCTPWEGEPLVAGESVAVQGACLTVVGISSAGFTADVLQETLDCTNLGQLKRGAPLNLERALRLCDRMGGHIVGGHVDGVGRLELVEKTGRDIKLRISCREEEARYIVRKGSVAIDGISLTASAVPGPRLFEVAIIPTTWRETSLGARVAGDTVNIETDVIARYIEKLIGGADGSVGLTFEKLINSGFSTQP